MRSTVKSLLLQGARHDDRRQIEGTANNASTIVLGDFTQMMLGVRSELRIEVLREKYADTLQYGFIAHLRFDVQLAHAQSFAKLIGITP